MVKYNNPSVEMTNVTDFGFFDRMKQGIHNFDQ